MVNALSRQLPRIASAVATVVLLGACGAANAPSAAEPIPAPPVPVERSTADAVLTTIAPLDVRYPELFNEQGCAVGAVTPALNELSPEAQAAIKASLPPLAQQQVNASGDIDLDAMPPEVLGTMLEANRTEVTDCNISGRTPVVPWEFYGYLGTNARRLAPGAVEARTVVGDDGKWGAIGHAAAPSKGGTITVTATLVSNDGSEIGSVSAESPVRGARPGEPVAFHLTSTFAATDVAKANYVVTEAGGTASRGLTIMVEDVVAQGPASIVIGNVTNSSDVPIANPAGVVAVLDAAGQVMNLVSFTVTQPGTTDPMTSLAPGFSGTFEVTVNDPAHSVHYTSVEVWAFGS